MPDYGPIYVPTIDDSNTQPTGDPTVGSEQQETDPETITPKPETVEGKGFQLDIDGPENTEITTAKMSQTTQKKVNKEISEPVADDSNKTVMNKLLIVSTLLIVSVVKFR